MIRDQAGPLQRPRDDGDGGAGGAEHHRDEFLRQRELLGPHAVLRHQEPPRQPLLDGVHGVAGGRLHDEADERLCVAAEQLVERSAPIHFAAKGVHSHAVADVRFALHHRGRRWRAAVQQRGGAQHAFPSDGGDFHHPAIFEHRHHRTEAAARKIDVVNGFARLVQQVFELEGDDVERWNEAVAVDSGQGGKKQILNPRRRRPVHRLGRRSTCRANVGRTIPGHIEQPPRRSDGVYRRLSRPSSALFRARQAVVSYPSRVSRLASSSVRNPTDGPTL